MSKKRIVLCIGPHCDAGGRAQPLYDQLREALGEPCPAFMARGRDHWETANCLSMCGGGPNLAVYPDGEWYHWLDADGVAQVIEKHLRHDGRM